MQVRSVELGNNKLSKKSIEKNLKSILVLSISILVFVYMSIKDYYLFHTLVEMFVCIISFSTFFITMSTYKSFKFNSFIFLGIAYGFVGIFNIMHTFTCNGIEIFSVSLSLNNLSAQLSLCSKYIESVSFLLLAIVMYKAYEFSNLNKVLHYYLFITIILLLSIFKWGIFPQCFINSEGFTSFRIISGIIALSIMIFSGILVFKGRNQLDFTLTVCMEHYVILSMIAEIMLLFMGHKYIYNVAGHILKALSFYFIYKSVIKLEMKTYYKMCKAEFFKEQFSINNYLKYDKIFALGQGYNEFYQRSYNRVRKKSIILEHDECYNILVENSKDAMFLESRGKIIFANKEALKLLEVSSMEDVEGKDVMDFIYYDRREYMKKDFNKKNCYESFEEHYELDIVSKEGKCKRIEVRETCFVSNGVPMTFSIVRDINLYRKVEKLEDNVRESEKKLKEVKKVNDSMIEYFQNISHDFKTPLNVILSAIQLVSFYKKSNKIDKCDKINKYIGVIKQNCYRLLKLVNNIVDMSKVDSGFLKLNLNNYNIVSVVEDITLSVTSYMESKGVKLIFDTDVEEKIMAFDSEKIERIMLNLLSNSAKFTNPKDEILVRIIDKKDKVLISVKDTGIGIPKDKQKFIFKRFNQVDLKKNIKRNFNGSGIGLALVKSFVEMHKGNIRIRSKEREGSEFIIELPAKILPHKETKENIKQANFENNIDRVRIEFSDICK